MILCQVPKTCLLQGFDKWQHITRLLMNMSGLEAEHNVQSDLMALAYVLNINLTILNEGQTKLR